MGCEECDGEHVLAFSAPAFGGMDTRCEGAVRATPQFTPNHQRHSVASVKRQPGNLRSTLRKPSSTSACRLLLPGIRPGAHVRLAPTGRAPRRLEEATWLWRCRKRTAK
jgi:hypothetical protein